MTSTPWLHKDLKREDVEGLLGTEDGKFLVRTKKGSSDLILSVVYKGRPTHHTIQKDEDGHMLVNKRKYGDHDELFKLIAHLGEKRKGWPVALNKPVLSKEGEAVVEDRIEAATGNVNEATDASGADSASSSKDEPVESRKEIPRLSVDGIEVKAIDDKVDDGTEVVMRKKPSKNAVRLVAETSIIDNAETFGTVYVAFMMKGNWTEPMKFFEGAKQGEIKSKVFDGEDFVSKPESIRFSISDKDGEKQTWGFWRIEADGRELLRDPNGVRGRHMERSRYWLDSSGDHGFMKNVFDIEIPVDEIVEKVHGGETVDDPNEGAWLNTHRGYRRSSFVRKGSRKRGQRASAPTVAPMHAQQSPNQIRLEEIVKGLFHGPDYVPDVTEDELVLTRDDHSIRFTISDLYNPLKAIGALSSDRTGGAFDLAETIKRADQEDKGEVNLFQFIGALDPAVEVEAVARAAAARRRYENEVQAKDNAVRSQREAEELRYYQELAWREAEERERAYQEQWEFEQRQVQQMLEAEERRKEEERKRRELEMEEIRKKEKKKRQAANRSVWRNQEHIFPWDVQQSAR